MAASDEIPPSPPPRRRRRRLWPWLVLILAVAFWFGHEPALVWAARKGLAMLDEKLGLRLEIGHIQLHLFQPIELRDVHFKVMRPKASLTDATARRIVLTTHSLWEICSGDGRVFRDLVIEQLDGTFDFRKPAIVPQPMPSMTREQQEEVAALILRFLPTDVRIVSSNAVFLADGQSYTAWGLNANFSESASGDLRLKYALIQAGSIRQEINDAHAVTAWKDGALYLSDLHLRKDIVLRDFVANFTNFGGVSLDWDAGVYGGTLRGNVAFGAENNLVHIKAAVSIVNVPVKPIPDLIALPAKADGIIRDARLTFRGNPDRPLDNEISLRLAADNFLWNERGWQSLVAGVTYIGRRLYVSTFELTQADNRISASGELAVPEKLADFPKTHYLLNLSADVRDLTDLAALAGPPFDQLHGQLYLHGAFEGDKGALHGYLNGEASDVRYQSLPPASARLSAVAENDELQIRYANLWAGNDRLEARGTVGLFAPHRYAGEVKGSIEDLGLYTPFAGREVAENVFTGAATLDWQGDGAGESHSGAFHLRLDNVATTATPTGLTGEFAGTYSPQNIYFKTVRLTHGALELNSQLTISSSGINVTGLSLMRRNLRLLGGDGFVPLDVFALAGGKPLGAALDTKRPVYASFLSGDLPVADLIQMAGQKADVRGQVRLNLGASGLLPELKLAGRLTGRNLSATVEDFAVPSTAFDVDLGTAEGRLAVNGSIQTQGFKPLSLVASMPFVYEQTADGGVRWFREDAPFDATLTFPQTGLEIFRSLVPAARHLEGMLAGKITAGGTLKAPKFDGEVTLSGGDIEISGDVPRVTALDGRLTMDASRVNLQSLRGTIGAGPIEATGWADIRNPKDPELQLHVKGSKVLLARDPGLRVRADVDVTAHGRGASGSITGSVQLVDGRIFRKLEVTPLLVPNPVNGPLFVPPTFAGLAPEPWSRWTLDVSIKNGAPFLLMGNLATGEISPDLSVKGTLGEPFAAGTVYLKNLQAYLPASTLLIPEGKIYFTRQNPFMPIMDVRARSEVSGYNVQMYAYGPLDQSNLALRSDPPLSQENLIFLLTTGLTPAGMSGAGLGEAAAGQGGIILLRSIARQLEPLGVDFNGLVNRLSVRVVPPKDPSQTSSLTSELRLTDGFSLTTGRDGYGFYNAGVQYTIRLR